jgi:hypothetical protein
VLTGIGVAVTASISGCLDSSSGSPSEDTSNDDVDPLPDDIDTNTSPSTTGGSGEESDSDGSTVQGSTDFTVLYTDGDLVASHSSNTEIRRFTVTNVSDDVVASTSVAAGNTQTVLIENITEQLDPYNTTSEELRINDFTVAALDSTDEELSVEETEYTVNDIEFRGGELTRGVFTYNLYNPNDVFIQYTYGVFTTPRRVLPKAVITDSETPDGVYRTPQSLPVIKRDSNTFVLNDDNEVSLSRELDDPHTLSDSNDIGYSDPINTGESLNQGRMTVGFSVNDLTVTEQVYVANEDILSSPRDVDETIELPTITVLNFQASGEMQIPVTLRVPGYKTSIEPTGDSENNIQQYTITYTPKSIEYVPVGE